MSAIRLRKFVDRHSGAAAASSRRIAASQRLEWRRCCQLPVRGPRFRSTVL